MEEEKKFLNAFNLLYNFGPKRLARIESFFNSFQEAWYENNPAVFKKAGITAKKSLNELSKREEINPEKEVRKLEKEEIRVITKSDPSYPKRLGQISDSPFLLYLKGNPKALSGFNIAVVGTRSFTPYGKEVTPYLTRKLVYQGITVVSGLAKGIDTFAHRACLEAGGRTVAVLPTGLDRIYPRANKSLAQKIIENKGAVVSENPLGTEPQPFLFPIRNRIISGLSRGVLVVEAGQKSGALITADSALDQNREVFSVPGDIFSSSSKGANKLIKQGAKPVTCLDDIIEEFNLEKVKKGKRQTKIIPETTDEKKILKVLNSGSTHIDVIIEKTGLGSEEVASVLTALTIKDKIKEMGGGMYALKR